MSREDVRDTDDYMEVNICMVGEGHGHNEPAGTVTSKFVAGCDVVVDVIPKTPGAGYQWADSKSARHHLDYRRPRTSVPSFATRRRWEFMVQPTETFEEAMDDNFI
jgi:hypothetical protein